ncbi:hypothetical protein ACSV5G_10785 [Agrobacterium cavarae]|uniref:hypothetical protein n=1 Tax=Agrobacterium cavarae TaxID=2528239 RepID=UPI003FD41483
MNPCRDFLRASIALGAVLMASGCEKKEDRLVGNWVVGRQTLDIKADGQFSFRKDGTEQTGTWQHYGTDVVFTTNRQDMTCSTRTSFENQLMLGNSINDGNGCNFASPYWRFDLPAEKRASALIAFDCKTQGQKVDTMPYTEAFRIEADKHDEIACFGKTSADCQLVWSASLVDPDYFSMFVTWGNGTGSMFEVRKGNGTEQLQLLQSSSNSCETNSGLASCTFSSTTLVGTCERATP